MNVRTRFALAFAAVAITVAALVGLLSYTAAADRIENELDRTLQTATTALANGQDGMLDAPATRPPGAPGGPGHGRGDNFDEERRLVAQAVAPDGTPTLLGGRDLALPVSPATRVLAAAGQAGSADVTEVEIGGEAFRVMTTALSGGRGALQVGVDIEDTQRVLNGMAIEITWASLAVLFIAAGAGWLLAGRITARLARLARQAEHFDLDDIGRDTDGVVAPLPVEGRDEVARLSTSFNTMLARLAAARDDQERLVQDAAHELRTPLTSLRTNASVLGRFAELSPDARGRLVADVQGETRELSQLVEELVSSPWPAAATNPSSRSTWWRSRTAPPNACSGVPAGTSASTSRAGRT